MSDPLAAVLAGSNFEWGEPTTIHEVDLDLPPSAWSSDKLGRADLPLWFTGEARLSDPYSAAAGYEGDRVTFYGIEVCEVVALGASGRRGRTKGSGSFAAVDAALVVEMRHLIEDGRAFSPDDAAKQVAGCAAGGGTEASKATRLAKRYRESEIE